MTRPLRYPLQYPITIVGDSLESPTIFSLDGWQALDSDTEIDIVMRVSLNQYTQIASALDVGRDIAYPQISENIWSMFVSRIVSMSICDSVANCIENSDVVQTSIENFLTNNSTSITTINTRIDSLENATMSTIANDLCDDRRFGGIRAVIERLDVNSIDFLENASDDLRDVFERVDTIIEAIPVYGDIADIMLDFAQSASQDALDEYTAQSTQALKDIIACDIFCNTSGCEITIDDVINAYKSLLPPSFDTAILETLADVVTWFVSGNVQSDTWFALVNLSQLFVIKLVKEFFGFTLPVFKIEFARGSNNPDNTHTLLCSCGSVYDWTYTWNFENNLNGFDIQTGILQADGVHVDASGYVHITRDITTQGGTINYARLEIYRDTINGGASSWSRLYIEEFGSFWVNLMYDVPTTNVQIMDDSTLSTVINRPLLSIRAGDNAVIKSLTISGMGANPFT